MEFTRLKIPDVIRVQPNVFPDTQRGGYFLETYHAEKYRQGGIGATFIQDNHSRSARGVLRGLHAQLRHPQGKLVRVIAGEIFDVAVDIRRGSPTFGRWVGETLTGDSYRQLYVPPGFAHGFCVLSEWADFAYKCTDVYDPEHEITISWNDPELGIEWPLENPILSEKDQHGKPLSELLERLPEH